MEEKRNTDPKEENISQEQNMPKEENIPKFRGLYRYVKIPVWVLDIIIGVCILVIVVIMVISLQNPGFTITFDSKGGTDVPAQNQMYGELLTPPAPPTREGYTFTGWHTDYGCDEPWDTENAVIEVDMTLYAGWEENP